MKYEGKIVISDKDAAMIKRYTEVEPKCEEECFLGDPIVYTYRFINGVEADVKCCSVSSYEEGGCNTAWTEAVLFDEHHHEVCVTDVCEEYEGIWELEYDGNQYKVEVMSEFGRFAEEAYRLYKLDWMMTHNISPEDVVAAIEAQILEDPETSVSDAFDAVENEVGFKNGCMWVCFNEFLTHEFKDYDYLKKLMGNAPLETRLYFYREIMELKGNELREAIA